MFTKEEALALWDDLTADKDAFLVNFGEMVLTKGRKYPYPTTTDKDSFGYFIRARNHRYTKEMLEAYNRICIKHNCTYRIDTTENDVGIFFFKDIPIPQKTCQR